MLHLPRSTSVGAIRKAHSMLSRLVTSSYREHHKAGLGARALPSFVCFVVCEFVHYLYWKILQDIEAFLKNIFPKEG